MKFFFDDGNQHIGRYGAPNLRLHRVLASSQKSLDAQVLLVKFEQPSKIQIAPVHDVEGARFERQDVEHVHIAEFAVADMDERGDCPSQIQQRMHLHTRLSRAKWRPIEQTQTHVDGGGVQRADGGIEINAHGLFDVEFPGIRNQAHGQRVINAPVPQIQGIGQSRASGNALHAHVKQLRLIGSEAHLDVAQRFAPGQLRKRHHAKHIITTERANARVAVVAFNDATKSFPWSVLHDLCKKRLAGVHAVPQVVQTCVDIGFLGDGL